VCLVCLDSSFSLYLINGNNFEKKDDIAHDICAFIFSLAIFEMFLFVKGIERAMITTV
jgi:hypothetical protein